jgi:pectate lyase
VALAAGLAVAAPASAGPAPTGGGVIKADDAAPTGWAAVGRGTNGGAGAPAESRYEVGTLSELKAALANNGKPTAPKIVYIKGTVDGNQAPDGRILGEQDSRRATTSPSTSPASALTARCGATRLSSTARSSASSGRPEATT